MNLNELLQDEFRQRALRRLEDGKQAENVLTNRGQAAFLGVSAGHLSRLRNGRAEITAQLASDFARRLRTDAEERGRFAELLLRASHQSSLVTGGARHDPVPIPPLGSLEGAADFFARHGNSNSLLCVEYRDLPQTGAHGKYPALAEIAARAVADGLCFAMFQPFGNEEGEEDELEGGGAEKDRYLLQLMDWVREVHSKMLQLAISFASKTPAEDIRRRLVLYERNGSIDKSFGIQSRLFYAENDASPRVSREAWQWITTPDDDFFLSRGEDSSFLSALVEQFVPIPSYWRKHRKLPGATDIKALAATGAAVWSVHEQER